MKRLLTITMPSKASFMNYCKDYCKESLIPDLKAGFVTALVALPLAIAFAIASGVHPIMGLYTAIIAGILGSTFGGSRFSITGPTGAMTVIILSTVNKYGIEGLLVAGMLAGIIQILFGVIKLGSLVKFIPFPIISGFTAGIGVIIFFGQIPNALGLVIPAKEKIWETASEILINITHINITALLITIFTILCLVYLPKLLSTRRILLAIPPSLIPLLISTIAVVMLNINIPLVGEIPTGFPTLQFININLELVQHVLPAAFTIALLGLIEALLCAVVCDGMTNTKHNSNKELIGQGICNLVMPFFNGIPSTAAIARSAVNIREGARTRLAGVYHALILLLIVLLFASAAKYIPKSFLAGILMVVSAKMININEFKTIIKISKEEAIVLFTTFFFTVFTDLVLAVEIGMVLAIFLLFIKLTQHINLSGVEDINNLGEEKQNHIKPFYFQNQTLKDVVSVYTLHGPFFFGAMSVFEKKITEFINTMKPIIIIRFKYVPFVDTTALVRLNEFIKDRQREKSLVILADITPAIYKTFSKDKEFCKLVMNKHIFPTTRDALHYVEKNVADMLIER